MAIQIKYAQSYMQMNGQMTIDVLLSSNESSNIVVGIDPYSSDATPKSIGPRFVMCVTANDPCFAVRLTNITFNDPFNLYMHRCIAGPNCGGPSCTTFSSIVDSSYKEYMVDFSGTGIPSAIFGSPYTLPSNVQGTCVTTPPPHPPPPTVSKSISFEVAGSSGNFIIYKGLQLMGTAMNGLPLSVSVVNGDTLTISAQPGIGSTFVNICDVPQTQCVTQSTLKLDVLDVNILAQKMVATFTVGTPPIQVPNVQIFNWCWGETGKLGTTCPMDAGVNFPAVAVGTSIDIKADISNSGATGSVMVNFEIDGIVKYTDTNKNLGPYRTSTDIWSTTYSGFIMPTKNVSLSIKAYNWNGTTWVISSGQTKTSTISMTAVGCNYVTLTPFSQSIKTGDKVNMVASISPGNVPFTVTFKDRSGTILGSCKTSGTSLAAGYSTCPFTWDSSASYAGGGSKAGTYYVKAYTNGCMSTESVIVVDAPILQYNFNITVVDSVTGIVISGATVLIATTGGASQSKVTDTNGLATFRTDTGTISVSISKNGYNTFNTVESLYNDKTITYNLVSTPPTPTVGDIQFVSIPVGADIYVDGKIQTGKTPATITGIPAGSHNWSLKLPNFNDSNGTVVVPSGGTTPVYTTLTPVSPTSGSLNITSTPMGANVTIDGKDTGQTTSGATVITNVTPGAHTFVLTMTGYQDKTGTFSIVVGTTTYLNIEMISLVTIGTSEISSDPSGARVWIDDKDTSRITPATITNLTAGGHTYKLVLSGYKDISGKFAIEAGKTVILHLILEKSEAGVGGAGIALAAIAGFALIGLMRKE